MVSPVAGWYPDPTSDSNIRWWDGSTWTEHVQPHPETETETEAESEAEAESDSTAVIAAVERSVASLNGSSDHGTPLGGSVTTTTIKPLMSSEADSDDDGSGLADAFRNGGAVASTLRNDSDESASIDVDPRREDADLEPTDGVDRGLIIGAFGVIMGAISLFLPWMTSSVGTGGAFDQDLPWAVTGGDLATLSAGTLAHGLLYLVLLVLAVIFLSGRVAPRRLSMYVGLVVLGLTGFNYLGFSGSTGDVPGLDLAVGSGLFVMGLAGLMLLAGGGVSDGGPHLASDADPSSDHH